MLGLLQARGRFNSGAARNPQMHQSHRMKTLGIFDQAMHLARVAEALDASGHAVALKVVAEVKGAQRVAL